MMADLSNDTVLLALPNKSETELERFFVEKAITNNPDAVLSNVLAFEKAVYAFNDLKPDFKTFEPLNTLCNAKGVNEILKIVPDWEFNREIAYYLAYIAWNEGWVKMPEPLSFAQTELNKIVARPAIGLTEEEKQLQDVKHLAVKKYIEGTE